MGQFAFFHINKYSGKLNNIGAHIDRLHVSNNVNPDKIGFNEYLTEGSFTTLADILGDTIDPSKSHLNTPRPKTSLKEDVYKRIKEGYKGTKAIRKDAVLAMGMILTGSHERMKEIEADDKLFEKWKKANYDFVCKHFYKENIVRFTLHIDEKTAHIHAVVVPITKDGRLSCKDFTGGSKQLSRYQDDHAAFMKPFGLERGVPKIVTHRLHIKGPEYDRQLAQTYLETEEVIKEEVNIKNISRLGKVRSKLTENLTKLKVDLKAKETTIKYLTATNQNLIDKNQKEVFQRVLEENSNETIEWIKKEIEIVPFLTSRMGWKIDKSKTSARETGLIHPTHGRIFVPSSRKPSTGHWVYWDANTNKGGTLIDLLRKIENWSWPQIKELANDKMILPAVALPTYEVRKSPMKMEEDPVKQEKMALDRFNSIQNTTSKITFLSHRAIDRTTFEGLQGLRVSQKEAIFALYTEFGKDGQFRPCSTIIYFTDREGNNKKYFQGNLYRGLSVLTDQQGLQAADRIIITESPVDALSYKQLMSETHLNWRQIKIGQAHHNPSEKLALLSTCGSIKGSMENDLMVIMEMARINGQTITIAMDNDRAGRKMAQQLIHIAEQARCTYTVEVPTIGKDWNEMLTSKAMLLDRKQEELIAAKEWETFEEQAVLEVQENQTLLKVQAEPVTLPSDTPEEPTERGFEDQDAASPAITPSLNTKPELLKLQEEQAPVATEPIKKEKQGWDRFETTAYQGSLLAQLGIEKDTYAAFKDVIKTSEETVLVALKTEEDYGKLVANWRLDKDRKAEQKLTHTSPIAILKGTYNHAATLVLVSSPIDALIHYQNQENHNNVCYVYADTRSKETLETVLIDLLSREKDQDIMTKIVVASSEQQTSSAKVIERILEEQELVYSSSLVEASKHATRNIAWTRWRNLQEAPYEHSLLPHLGIEKDTYEYFKDILKTGENKAVVALGKDDAGEELAATWSMDWSDKKGFMQHFPEKSGLSILKGKVSQAEKVVLVQSPLDALFHYQVEGKGKDICYVYADARDISSLETPLKRLKDFVDKRDIEFAMARYGDENVYTTKKIQNILAPEIFKAGTLKPYTDLIKKEIPLVPFLTTKLGWQVLDEQENNQQGTALIHPENGQKIIVAPKPNAFTGHHVYTDSEGYRKTLIDLLRDEDWSWNKIKELAEEEVMVPSKILVPIEVVASEKIYADYSPLARVGILPSTYEDLTGISMSYNKAVFDIYQFDPGEKGVLSSSYTITKDQEYGGIKSYFKKGTKGGVSVLLEKGQTLEEANTIVITQSPTDALSYRQLLQAGKEGWEQLTFDRHQSSNNDGMNEEDGRDMAFNNKYKFTQTEKKPVNLAEEKIAFISTCGNKRSHHSSQDIDALISMAKKNNQKVIIAFNGDTQSRDKVYPITYELARQGIAQYIIEKPIATSKYDRSWIGMVTEQKKIAEQEAREELAAKKWEDTKRNTSFTHSVLRFLGIDKHTQEAFQDTVRATDKEVVATLREPQGKLLATWRLNYDQEHGYQESIDPQPGVSLLKGNLAQAEKVVVVASPLDALTHYQSEKQAYAQNDQNDTAYLYLNPSTSKEDLQEPLESIGEKMGETGKELTLAYREDDESHFSHLTDLLNESQRNYNINLIKGPTLNDSLTKGLGSIFDLLTVIPSPNASIGEEQDEEKDKKKKITSKRGR
ncbi:MAG: MobV family relaxase [Candidatus Amoebophilus sp.]